MEYSSTRISGVRSLNPSLSFEALLSRCPVASRCSRDFVGWKMIIMIVTKKKKKFSFSRSKDEERKNNQRTE